MSSSIAIPAVVINLARSRDRRAHMEAQLKGSGLDYHFFEAVDGAKLTPAELALYDEQAAFQCVSNPLTKGEIGCALSHVRVYEWMVKKRLPRLLIMEDDASLKEHFFTAIAHADQWLPPKWGIINFFDTFVPDLAPGTSLLYRYMIRTDNIGCVPNHYLYYFARDHHFAICYLIHLSAAERLLSIAYPIRMPADALTGFVSVNKLRSYTILPRLVGFHPTKSTIGALGTRAGADAQVPVPTLRQSYAWFKYTTRELLNGYLLLAPRYPKARKEIVQRLAHFIRTLPNKLYHAVGRKRGLNVSSTHHAK